MRDPDVPRYQKRGTLAMETESQTESRAVIPYIVINRRFGPNRTHWQSFIRHFPLKGMPSSTPIHRGIMAGSYSLIGVALEKRP